MKQARLGSLLLLVLLSFPIYESAAIQAAPGAFIMADGTVQGTTKIQRTGEVYTFLENFAGPLFVKKDNIVIDGAGYTVTGGSGRGIVLENRTGVTLKNTKVTLEGGYVIDMRNTSNCIIEKNTLIGTPKTVSDYPSSPSLGPIAINLLHSKNITIKDNAITNFFYGLSLEWSSGHTITGNVLSDGIIGIEILNTTGCIFRNNILKNCQFSIRTYQNYTYDNDLDASNTVNGKPVCYWVNVKDKTVPNMAAYIVLTKCSNITIKNDSPQGICLASTTNCMISNVTMNGRGDGITLQDCSSVTIADCHLLDNAIGIEIANSSNTTILRNEIANHPTRAINLGKGKDNIIANNVFINNSYAIAPFQDEHCNGNMIISNTFRRNDFSITANSKMTISGNSFEDNNHAIMLSGSGSAGTTVTQNSFSNNRNALYISGSSGNSIYLNNFFENEHQVTDAGVKSSSVKTTKRELNSETLLQPQAPHFNSLNFIQPPPPSTNQYDNGAKGNYWIDYDGSDKNKDGIGDTAYLLYENNQDNHPLISPYTVPPSFTIPSAPPTIDPEQNQEELASFPLTLTIAALALTIIGFALGLLYYRKKQRHQAV